MSDRPKDYFTPLESQIRTVKAWALFVPGGLEGDDWLARPDGMKNHPHWLFGHVTVFSDFLPKLTEIDSVIPEEWHGLFGLGSVPEPEGTGYPSIDSLSEVLTTAMDRNLSQIRELDPVELQKPPLELPEEALRHFKSRERWLFFAPLHLTYHLGQIQQIQRILHPRTGGI